MVFNSLKKEKLFRIFSIFLSLWLVVYSFSPIVLFKASYSYAQETCDSNDDDYQECLKEQEQERLEEEKERQQKEQEQQTEQVREERETISEEHEDDPNWVAPWLITPTPVPSATSAPEPTTSALNSQTGEGSQNEAVSNSASEIDVENINSTNLDQESNVVANTGGNIVSDELPPENSPQDGSDFQFNPNNPAAVTSGPTNQQSGVTADNSEKSVETDKENNLSAEESEDISFENEKAGQENDFNKDSSGESLSQGEGSEQVSISEDKDEITVHNDNDLELTNEMEVKSTSGQSSLVDNEDNSSLETGGTLTSADMMNVGNVNTTENEGPGKAEAVNEDTAPDSSNFTSDEVSQTTTVVNDNVAAVENNLEVSSTSGKNELSKNEGDATLTTGEVDIIVNLLNILNLNITGSDFTHLIVNIFGNLTGEFDLDDISEKYLGLDEDDLVAIAKNSNTGDDSQNTALAKSEEKLDVQNQNNAALVNNVQVEGVSGQNDLSENEGNVNVLTGRIKILTSILNFINANFSGTDWYFAMINIFGTLEGDILLPDPNSYLTAEDGSVTATNKNTGDDSQNQALAEKTENVNVKNDNSAQVENKVNAVGDSGTNQAYANEDETTMETGKVDVTAQLMNWLNYNIFGDRWVMVVVNVFGHWLGKIVAFPGKGDINAPESGTLVAVANGQNGGGPEVLAENESTGENSQNSAAGTSESDLSVSNENKAYVENNVDVTGVSGQNTTNENEDPVGVSTGWIDLDVNLFNIVNFNVAGRQWMLLIVNVFGDFLGNIIFPHEEAKEAQIATQALSQDDFQSGEAEVASPANNSGSQENDNSSSATEDNNEEDKNEEPTVNSNDEEKASLPKNNLIKSNQRSHLASVESAKADNLDYGDGLDNSLNIYYNSQINDQYGTYNLERQDYYQEGTNFISSFQKIIENLINILASLFVNIF